MSPATTMEIIKTEIYQNWQCEMQESKFLSDTLPWLQELRGIARMGANILIALNAFFSKIALHSSFLSRMILMLGICTLARVKEMLEICTNILIIMMAPLQLQFAIDLSPSIAPGILLECTLWGQVFPTTYTI